MDNRASCNTRKWRSCQIGQGRD